MYCKASKIAAKIFKGNEDDAGLIHYQLHDLLETSIGQLPANMVESEILITSICLSWAQNNPNEKMFGE